MLVQHLPHDLTHRTGGPDDRNARLHESVPFIE
jgi:hypothetical protein